MARRALLLLAAVCALAGTAAPAGASPRMLKGIYDDANLLYGDPDRAFKLVGDLRAGVVRLNLNWGGPYGVAKAKPGNGANPEDPKYDWEIYDRAVLYATQYRAQVVFSIVGTPAWANGGRPTNVAPSNPLHLRKFALAAAKRYSGRFARSEDGKILPGVRLWLAWNEPNNPVFLAPQFRDGRMAAPAAYAKICNAVVSGIGAARVRGNKVACGVTAPRGNNNPASGRPSTSPLAFLRAMKKAGAKGFHAYAHHPYYGGAHEQPTTRPPSTRGARSTAVTLGNLGDLVGELTRLYGRKPIWITEYGYQTNPPDKVFGVSYAKQAAYMKQAFAMAKRNARVDMFVWFLLKDEPRLAGWQSGLMTAADKKKPAFAVFRALR